MMLALASPALRTGRLLHRLPEPDRIVIAQREVVGDLELVGGHLGHDDIARGLVGLQRCRACLVGAISRSTFLASRPNTIAEGLRGRDHLGLLRQLPGVQRSELAMAGAITMGRIQQQSTGQAPVQKSTTLIVLAGFEKAELSKQ